MCFQLRWSRRARLTLLLETTEGHQLQRRCTPGNEGQWSVKYGNKGSKAWDCRDCLFLGESLQAEAQGREPRRSRLHLWVGETGLRDREGAGSLDSDRREGSCAGRGLQQSEEGPTCALRWADLCMCARSYLRPGTSHLEGLEALEPDIHSGLPSARLKALEIHRHWAECTRVLVQRQRITSTRLNRTGPV